VHKYFNPYNSPYDSYINFMNVLGNLSSRCSKASEKQAATQTPQQKATQRFVQAGSHINNASDLQTINPCAPANQD